MAMKSILTIIEPLGYLHGKPFYVGSKFGKEISTKWIITGKESHNTFFYKQEGIDDSIMRIKLIDIAYWGLIPE